MTLSTGPCAPWPAVFTCDVSQYDPALTGYAVDFASYVVWALSGRQFGTCSTTLRPCLERNFQPWPGAMIAYPWASYGMPSSTVAWDASYWFPFGQCGCTTDDCSCARVSQVRLPARVNTVTQVKVDGVVLDPSAYRLDNNRILVRTDGQMWPRCNDLTLPDTAVGTWSVTADYGASVPQSGQLAVGEMACQILRAINGSDCQLPANVTQLIRQGVTMSFPTFQELLKEGRTGLYLVDLFITMTNPNGLSQRPRVYNIDRPPVRRAGS